MDRNEAFDILVESGFNPVDAERGLEDLHCLLNGKDLTFEDLAGKDVDWLLAEFGSDLARHALVIGDNVPFGG